VGLSRLLAIDWGRKDLWRASEGRKYERERASGHETFQATCSIVSAEAERDIIDALTHTALISFKTPVGNRLLLEGFPEPYFLSFRIGFKLGSRGAGYSFITAESQVTDLSVLAAFPFDTGASITGTVKKGNTNCLWMEKNIGSRDILIQKHPKT